MKAIVCGSAPRVRGDERPGWTDRNLLFTALDYYDVTDGPLTVIEGEAPGADKLAREWAEERRRTFEPYPANWSRGRAAGPIRNQRMIDEGKPGLVLAFSTDWPLVGGTRDMVGRARAANLPTIVITPDGKHRNLDDRTFADEALAS